MVLAQLGMSLDGRIATPTGSSRGINGPGAMLHLHRIRALVDAVVIGAGTARIDNPRLTVRSCAGESPARVVIDPRGTVGPNSHVWSGDDGARRLVFGGMPELEDIGVERIAPPPGEIPPAWIVRRLRAEGLHRVLIEGGGKTVSQFVAAGEVELLHLLVGPVIIGSGLVGLALPMIDRLDSAQRPDAVVHVFDEGDVLFACRLENSGAKRARSVAVG